MQTYLKTKPAWVQLLLFFGMAFGMFLVLGLLGTVVLSQLTGVSVFDLRDTDKWSDNPNMIIFIRGMLVLQFLGLFAGPSLLFAYFSDPQPLQYVGLRKPVKPIYWGLAIVVMFLAIPLVEYTGLLNRQMQLGPGIQKWAQSMEDEAARQIQFMLSGNHITSLLWNIIFIALFAGVGEELFFRGVLQRLFIRATKNPWTGILITAFLFSFFHFEFFGFVPRFLLGILLGAIYWYSGSIWPAMLAHFAYDGFFVALAYFQPKMMNDPNATMFKASSLTLTALVSTALVLTIVWLMKKNSATTYAAVYKNDIQPLTDDFTF